MLHPLTGLDDSSPPFALLDELGLEPMSKLLPAFSILAYESLLSRCSDRLQERNS